MSEFCYLGDMLGRGGGIGNASIVRVSCAWKMFTELSQITTRRGILLKLKGKCMHA